jgi:hypothetical protein
MEEISAHGKNCRATGRNIEESSSLKMGNIEIDS